MLLKRTYNDLWTQGAILRHVKHTDHDFAKRPYISQYAKHVGPCLTYMKISFIKYLPAVTCPDFGPWQHSHIYNQLQCSIVMSAVFYFFILPFSSKKAAYLGEWFHTYDHMIHLIITIKTIIKIGSAHVGASTYVCHDL